jgi:hypothetical protein
MKSIKFLIFCFSLSFSSVFAQQKVNSTNGLNTNYNYNEAFGPFFTPKTATLIAAQADSREKIIGKTGQIISLPLI